MDRLAELLPDAALDDAVKGLKPEELSGPGGLLSRLAGRVIQAALEAEMTDHLGHPPNGIPRAPMFATVGPPKTVHTDVGPVRIETPRDRDSSFEPASGPQAPDPPGGLGRQDPRPLRRRDDRPGHLKPAV
jgi:hypothetical protein